MFKSLSHSFKDKYWLSFIRELTFIRESWNEWNTTSHVLTSIFLASLLINLLSLALPLALLQVYDRIIPNMAISTLVLLVLGVFIALFLEAILSVTRAYVGAWADARCEHEKGCQGFRNLTECSLSEFQRLGAGRHLKHITALSNLRDFYAGQAIISLTDLPFVIILFALIEIIAGWLVLIPLIILLIMVFSSFFYAKNIQKMLQEKTEIGHRRANFIIETLNRIHTVKSVSMEAQMLRRYERLQRSSSLIDYQMNVKNNIPMVRSFVLSQCTIVLIVAIGAVMVIHGHLTVGGLAATTLLSGRVLQPINYILSVWTRLQTIKLARTEFATVLSMPTESSATAMPIKITHGKIEFRNMSFRYDENKSWVLKNINLTIEPKRTIAVKGNGLSGKSTLLSLIVGLYQPSSGEILIDGHNIASINLQTLREQIGYMPQKSSLFNGTFLENLTLFDDKYAERAMEIAEQVGLRDFIEHLEEGYNTPVADRNSETIPRGIVQRILIARALIRRPPIVLFDEANIAIDMQGDQYIKKLIAQLHHRCTLILVSHRPSILQFADQYYLLENGELREQV